MNSAGLYRKVLRSAKTNAPKIDQQSYRLWLGYNAKSIIYLYRNERNAQPLIESGLQDLDMIEKLWKNLKSISKNFKVSSKIGGCRSWIPGLATTKWLKQTLKSND